MQIFTIVKIKIKVNKMQIFTIVKIKIFTIIVEAVVEALVLMQPA